MRRSLAERVREILRNGADSKYPRYSAEWHYIRQLEKVVGRALEAERNSLPPFTEGNQSEEVNRGDGMSAYKWFAGWYATRLHAVPADNTENQPRSLCGAYVYDPEPPSDWAKRLFAAGPKRCKHCERQLAKMGEPVPVMVDPERLRLLEAVVAAAQPYRSDVVTDASVLNDIARRDALTKACLALDNYDKEEEK